MRLLHNALGALVVATALFVAQPVRAGTVNEPVPKLVAPLADSWTWDAFWKFWKRQLDRTAGVVGVVMLVAAAATLIIVIKPRR
jgi:hypothetical protein